MKAFLIARVSTDDQADALPAQVYRLKDYAVKMSFDYELFEIKESAYKGDRQKFNEVISKLFTVEETVALVFDKVDRYSRDSSSEQVRLLNTLTENGKVELHFSSDHLIIDKNSSAGQKLMLTMNTAFSEYYSNAISDNVKRRNEQLRRDGYWTGRAPVGYRNTLKDGKKWIDIYALEAQAIKDAFDMYSTGLSTLREIRDHWQTKYGIKAAISGIDKVLKNPFYYGVMRVQGRLYDHNYEPLVTKEIFDRAEAVRAGYKIKPHIWAGLPFPYRGLISCADCGARVTFEKKKGKYIYGHCTQSKGKHGAKSITEERVTEQLSKLLEQIVVPEDVCNQIVETLNADIIQRNKEAQSSKDALRQEISKYETRIDRLYDEYIDQKIDESFYTHKANQYREIIANLKPQVDALELSDSNHIETVSSLLEISKTAHKTFLEADYKDKRRLLKLVLSNLELKDKLLRCELKKPFDKMAFCNNNSTWQGHVESNHDLRFWRPIY